MGPKSYLLFLSTAICYAIARPAIDSTTFAQNTIDAQILNSEFQGLNETDPCDSGQVACVGSGIALCKFGSWDIQKCGPSNACFAVPSAAGSGTIITCTTEEDALLVFETAGAQSPFSNGTDTRAFPTVTPAPLNASSSANSAHATLSASPASTTATQSGVEVVTVTVTVPLTFSTSLPTEVLTIDPSEAASILSSLSAQGITASPVSPASGSPSLTAGNCQETASEESLVTTSVLSQLSAASSVSVHAYYHESRAARRA